MIVGSGDAEGVVLVIPQQERGVAVRIRNDRVALSFSTGLLSTKRNWRQRYAGLIDRALTTKYEI